MKTWRERSAPVIREALKKTEGQPEKDIRKALRDAYPFGERKYWPYKVWLDEVKKQRSGQLPVAKKGPVDDPRQSKFSFFPGFYKDTFDNPWTATSFITEGGSPEQEKIDQKNFKAYLKRRKTTRR